MASNQLRLNPAKTDVIWLGTSRHVQECTSDPLQLHDASIKPSNCVHDLGDVVDSGLTLVDHVTHITSVCFFLHSSQLWLIQRSLTVDTAHSLVRAFVNSRLDYCNALYATLPAGQMSRLQSVLWAAARLVLQLPGQAPVSSAMRNSLHWLNCVRIATVHGRSWLRSSDDHQLLTPRTHTVTLCLCAFNTSGTASWNALPAALHDPAVTLGTFRQMLKSFLFWLRDVYRGHGIRVTARAFVTFVKGCLKCLLLLLLLLLTFTFFLE